MVLPKQSHIGIALNSVPHEALVRLAQSVIAQAIKDARKGNVAAIRWLASKDVPVWAELCEVDQLWPPEPVCLSCCNGLMNLKRNERG